ncbi:GNAT family N-acetyltransferase [Nocardioides alcanivorans]|uniref:GNAT family N-acetyltransferase n=1 Tax=Nocardioides alcanivorans TaxID=2897352 RepID=UPI001F40BC1D|nr:GNAT family N-acetyltransferase [Nocardioides alcanivorans]
MAATLSLRPGSVEDLPQVADVMIGARRAAHPAMPPLARPEVEVRRWVAAWDLTSVDLWVAEWDEEIVGFASATPTWLDHLYVAPHHAGTGVGSALLALVQAVRPEGVGLWVFETNLAARRFYARHGFAELRRTDGSGNEEREPDIELSWRP